MLGITDLKTGVIFEDGGEPWIVLEYQHSKVARGGGFVRLKAKNIITGSIVDKTYKSQEKFQEVQIERRKVQYLYKNGDNYVFMDSANFEQFEFSEDILGFGSKLIKEGDEFKVQYYEGKPVAVNLPIKTKLKVTEAPKADKGNTAQAATKKITLETGYELQAPMFIKPGDFVIVDTRNGSYVERA